MNLTKIHNIYFLGIGGIGMSALARYFNAMGKSVAGYDKTPTKLTDELIAEGIAIHFEDNVEAIPEQFKSQVSNIQSQILVVYTPAIPKDHSEYLFFQHANYTIKKRAEVLGLITNHSFTIAVAGTHGKTTTSSLITHILKTANTNCSAFLGGITQNYLSNVILSKQPQNKDHIVVVEADEYDRSFLYLHPQLGVITSVDADHLDIYQNKNSVEESYNLFAKQVKQKLVVSKKVQQKIATDAITYSVSEQADFVAENIRIENAQYIYDINTPTGKIKEVAIGLPGIHNIENSLAATAIAVEVGIPFEKIKQAIESFKGVKRRFEYQIKTNELVYIDDYAHHPEELKACISSVKQLYPSKKITGIFQPHLYTRTRDFADEFAKSLDLLDEVILMEIYPARELPIEGVSSTMLLNKITCGNKSIVQKGDLVQHMKMANPQVLLTLGAGDIDLFVEPIKQALIKK